MKKMTMALAAALMLLACSKNEEPEVKNDGMMPVTISFTFPGDVTRGTLADASMADLWMFDYVDGVFQQMIHQQSDDEGFGVVRLSADYGVHDLYFVASAGKVPTVSGTEITWEKPADTFWAAKTLDIVPGMSTSQTVQLKRATTRLRIAMTDEVPAGLAQIVVTPTRWFNGIDYVTGEATAENDNEHPVNVPTSYIGTSGSLSVGLWSLSPSEPWMADVWIQAFASDATALADITLTDVPMERNRLTRYSGSLFGAVRQISLTVDDEWLDDYEAEW